MARRSSFGSSLGAAFALVIAVCGAPAQTAAAAAPAQATLRWSVRALAADGRSPYSYAEPGITAGPGGLLLADAASANTGARPAFWLSRDSGRSWSAAFDPTGLSTGDADVAIGPDGYLYALNLGYSGSSNPAVQVLRSRDGRSWSGPASFPAPHGSDQPDRPWLVVDPRHPADVDVVNSEGAGDFVLWHSSDHGASFSGPRPIGGGLNSQAALALSSRPLFDPTRHGRMYMVYETATPAGAADLLGAGAPLYEFPLTQLWLATSSDGGLTWSNRLALDTSTLSGPLHGGTLGHLLPATAIDAAGRLYVAFSLRPPGATTTQIYLVHSADHDESWSSLAEVPSPARSNVMPALAVTPGGHAFISWYASTDPDFRDAAARWVEMFASTAGPLAGRPAFTVGQVSGPAPVHVGGIDLAGAVGSDLGADWSLRDLQSITVDAASRPHLVWAADAGAAASTQTATLVPSADRHRHRHRGPARHRRRRHHRRRQRPA